MSFSLTLRLCGIAALLLCALSAFAVETSTDTNPTAATQASASPVFQTIALKHLSSDAVMKLFTPGADGQSAQKLPAGILGIISAPSSRQLAVKAVDEAAIDQFVALIQPYDQVSTCVVFEVLIIEMRIADAMTLLGGGNAVGHTAAASHTERAQAWPLDPQRLIADGKAKVVNAPRIIIATPNGAGSLSLGDAQHIACSCSMSGVTVNADNTVSFAATIINNGIQMSSVARVQDGETMFVGGYVTPGKQGKDQQEVLIVITPKIVHE